MSKKVWLTAGEYSQKYGVTYGKATELVRTGKIPSKKQGRNNLLKDMPPPQAESDMDSLKAQKLEAEIQRLKQMSDNERQLIKDEAVNEYKAEIANGIVNILKQLKNEMLECLKEDQEKQVLLKNAIDKFLMKLDSL